MLCFWPPHQTVQYCRSLQFFFSEWSSEFVLNDLFQRNYLFYHWLLWLKLVCVTINLLVFNTFYHGYPTRSGLSSVLEHSKTKFYKGLYHTCVRFWFQIIKQKTTDVIKYVILWSELELIKLFIQFLSAECYNIYNISYLLIRYWKVFYNVSNKHNAQLKLLRWFDKMVQKQ